MKNPLSLAVFVSFSLSVCLAAQHFCAAGIDEIFLSLFCGAAEAASAVFCGLQQLACLVYGIYLCRVSTSGGYCEKYFCAMCVLSWFIQIMAVYSGMSAFVSLPWIVTFFMFYAVVLYVGRNDSRWFVTAALPHGAITLIAAAAAFFV